MTCPMCNAVNRDDAKFCKKCGHSLYAGEAQPAPASTVNQSDVDQTASAHMEEDISKAPTLIISPQRMMEKQSQRWQREDEQKDKEAPVAPSDTSGADNHDAAPSPQDNAESTDIANLPTMIIAPPASESTGDEAENAEEDVIPPPPPDVPAAEATEAQAANGAQPAGESRDASEEQSQDEASEADSAGDAAATVKDTPEEVQMTEDEHEEAQETTQEAAPETGDFPPLEVGALVAGRYEVTQVDSAGGSEHLYQVIDKQGYQRCWNCGSEQNSEGDEFCIDCGAGLLGVSYIMHEYPATQNSSSEANVLHETIVNTFVDQGRTYVISQAQTAENPFPNGVHLSVASDSDAGNVRRSDPNEDSTLALLMQRIHESTATPAGLFVVADGMGGHDNGQRASHIAISKMAERITRDLLLAPLTGENEGEAVNPADEDSLVKLLHDAVEEANAAIYQENQRDKTDMGSTITGCLVVGDYAYIFNVGDSRTYMLRAGQIYQLTTDHSLVAQLVASGLIQPDDVYTHPQRSQIFRSLGDKLNIQIDIFKQQLHPGDILLSCCDGLWEMVRNPQIESILNEAPNPQAACSQLLDAANENGGEDNISVVVVAVH
jgi:serine/threonine protein phosphatase PrpC